MKKEDECRLDVLLRQFYETQKAISDLSEDATTGKMLRTIRRRNEARQAIFDFVDEMAMGD